MPLPDAKFSSLDNQAVLLYIVTPPSGLAIILLLDLNKLRCIH